MYLFKIQRDLNKFLEAQRNKGLSIGFVPTMGALHKGHLSLIKRSKSEADITICSIFVNPTQFNDPSDLEKYPRSEAKDIRLLTAAKANILFMPSVSEIYPPGGDTTVTFDFGQLDKVMEGRFRPGHFEGVAQVVKRLLDIVQPDKLFMGQKDFQQLTIVRDLLRQTGSHIELVSCPIIREPDGLAMSSRNALLSSADRARAPIIYQCLREAKLLATTYKPPQIKALSLKKLNLQGFRPEYFEIINGFTLQPVNGFKDSGFIVACTAAWLGEVRLIDNVVIKGNA